MSKRKDRPAILAMKTKLTSLGEHLATATGARAVPGSQRPCRDTAHAINYTPPAEFTMLRAGTVRAPAVAIAIVVMLAFLAFTSNARAKMSKAILADADGVVISGGDL